MMLTFHTNFSVTPLRYLGFHGCLLLYSAFSRACLKYIVIRSFTEIFTKDSFVVVSCSIDIGREVCNGLRSAVKTVRFSDALKYEFRRNSKQIQRMHCIHVVKTSAWMLCKLVPEQMVHFLTLKVCDACSSHEQSEGNVASFERNQTVTADTPYPHKHHSKRIGETFFCDNTAFLIARAFWERCIWFHVQTCNSCLKMYQQWFESHQKYRNHQGAVIIKHIWIRTEAKCHCATAFVCRMHCREASQDTKDWM